MIFMLPRLAYNPCLLGKELKISSCLWIPATIWDSNSIYKNKNCNANPKEDATIYVTKGLMNGIFKLIDV